MGAIAGVSLAWHHAPPTLTWLTFAWGFAHYLLALRYSGGQMRQILGAATQVSSLIGLVFLATTLYQVGFPRFSSACITH
jgi:hypothetical protein